MATIETALTRLLGIQHPILLAPMGSAAGGKLAAAVTHAGGLGMLGSGYASEAAIRKELAEAGNARVGVGFILWALDKNPQALDVALDARPAAIMLSFGDPSPYTQRIKAVGSKIICQVQTLEQAKQAADAGADVIIAQGRDAGGHSGMTRGTIGLVPAVVDAVGPIPVVAAGGIADGRGLAAALSLGAAGVSMGTRFTATAESLWDQAMKEKAVASGGDQTAQTRVFDIVRGAAWPAIYPGRALRNDFFAQWHGKEEVLAAERKTAETAFLATANNDFAQRVVWAGEGVDLVRDIPSARDVIERIVDEAASVLRGGAAMVRG
ncbi:MAG: nitronate monooxygenase [Reyranella sp.]|uniref:NAD(P)H-dependent flavin oxidoreductase n=1 Tax=Reyranella sp. TaxID=1929291 RepID=UPI001ACF1BAB|nr:nitronate monooxygenase [Reyranella sp.]MBN9091424.1 nitronate monooxygenase [Reyranella sp.]